MWCFCDLIKEVLEASRAPGVYVSPFSAETVCFLAAQGPEARNPTALRPDNGVQGHRFLHNTGEGGEVVMATSRRQRFQNLATPGHLFV